MSESPHWLVWKCNFTLSDNQFVRRTCPNTFPLQFVSTLLIQSLLKILVASHIWSQKPFRLEFVQSANFFQVFFSSPFGHTFVQTASRTKRANMCQEISNAIFSDHCLLAHTGSPAQVSRPLTSLADHDKRWPTIHYDRGKRSEGEQSIHTQQGHQRWPELCIGDGKIWTLSLLSYSGKLYIQLYPSSPITAAMLL